MHQSTFEYQQRRMPVSFAELEAIRVRPISNRVAAGPAECIIRRGDYTVCAARSSAQRLAASKLIERMYASRGYETQTVTIIPHNPDRMTFEASNREELVGTLTLGFDGRNGLLAERLYGEEIGRLRDDGRVVCELSRFAVDPDHGSKELMASLIQLAHINAIVREATDAVIEVNPRHAVFYKRMLGFGQIGETRICPRVNAPAVLLHLEIEYMNEQIRQQCGSVHGHERSLYPYFVREWEERPSARAA
jgi:hypothetical protein